MKKFSAFFPSAALCAALLAAGSAPALTVDDATVVSSASIAAIYKEDGSAGSFNGGHSINNVFDGNFTAGAYMNTAKSYIIVNLDAALPGGYYVTKILVGHVGNTKYSLYYTSDGTTWSELARNVQIAGTKDYAVNDTARQVKYVFETVVSWTPSLCEVQVWGVDPSQLSCLHSRLSDWVAIAGTQNCTESGVDRCECLDCGQEFTRQSSALPPLGHEYVNELETEGSGLHYGSGRITCSRHDFEICCTNGPVDLMQYGSVKTEGKVQFTDLSVSSTGNEDWGTRPQYLYDNGWTWQWGTYWYASTASDSEYIQYDFGVAIDLTMVDVSVHNCSQTIMFYSYDAESGAESLVGEHAVAKDSSGNDYQRMQVEFRGVTLKSLRVRIAGISDNHVNNANIMAVAELHPYGTVNGAGKSAAVRTRIIID